MPDNENKMLIYIPKNANYIEILGYRIDGFNSFEAFCEHLKKYAELEETVSRQKAEIERLCVELDEVIIAKDLLFDEAEALIKKAKAEAYKKAWEKAKKEVLIRGCVDVDEFFKELVGG